MKKIFAVVLIAVALSGCNAWIGSNVIDASDFVCRQYGGIQSINTFMNTTVTCRSGKTFLYTEAAAQYTKSMERAANSLDIND